MPSIKFFQFCSDALKQVSSPEFNTNMIPNISTYGLSTACSLQQSAVAEFPGNLAQIHAKIVSR